MVYRQTNRVIDVDFGEVLIYINLSDNLFSLLDTDVNNVTNIDFIEIDTLTKKIDIDKGEITSELKFSFDSYNASKVSTFYDFILSNNTLKYCSVVFNELTANNVVFIGIVQDDYEKDEYIWKSTLGATTLNDEAVYSMRAKPYSTIINNITIEELTTAINNDRAWINANVYDRPGYYKETIDAHIYEARALELVQLEVALRRLLQELETKLSAQGLPITFQYNDITLPFVSMPARFKLWNNEGTLTRYVKNPAWFNSMGAPYEIYGDDYYTAKLWMKDPAGNLTPLFINARLILNLTGEPDSEAAKGDKWTSYNDMIELLKKIAISLGIYVSYEFVSNNVLSIKFTPPKDFITNAYVYFSDATSSRLQVTSREVGEENYNARANYAANEGRAYYMKQKLDGNAMKLIKVGEVPEENLLPLSISPTLVVGLSGVYLDSLKGYSPDISPTSIPHSYGFYKDNALQDAVKSVNRGVTTGIFIPVGNYTAPPDSDYEPTAEAFYLPVAAIAVNLDNTIKTYFKIIDYIRDREKNNVKNYLYERKIDIPTLCGFSNNADLTGKSWSALQIGKMLLINGKDYIITEVEYNFNEVKTSITANTKSTFAYETPSGAVATGSINPPISYVTNVRSDDEKINVYTAYNLIGRGEVVALRSDGQCERAMATSSYFNRIIGIALNDANAGENCRVQSEGEVEVPNSFYTMTNGQKVYLRSSTSSAPNLHINSLTVKTAEEDLFCIIGKATGVNKYKIEMRNYVME